jgi:hypothetical protein
MSGRRSNSWWVPPSWPSWQAQNSESHPNMNMSHRNPPWVLNYAEWCWIWFEFWDPWLDLIGAIVNLSFDTLGVKTKYLGNLHPRPELPSTFTWSWHVLLVTLVTGAHGDFATCGRAQAQQPPGKCHGTSLKEMGGVRKWGIPKTMTFQY